MALASEGPLSLADERTTSAQSGLETLLTRMEQAASDNPGRYRAYSMTREYKLFGDERQMPKSQVLAEVDFVPPQTKTFRIVSSQGSGRGESVVRRVLEGESKVSRNRDSNEISRRNYRFELLGREMIDGHSCFVVRLTPLRDEKELVRGRAWVDAETFRIRQVQGEPAKGLSWWIKKTLVTIQYAALEGMWLPVNTTAIAEVRLFGRHVLASRALELRTGQNTIALNPPLPAGSLGAAPLPLLALPSPAVAPAQAASTPSAAHSLIPARHHRIPASQRRGKSTIARCAAKPQTVACKAKPAAQLASRGPAASASGRP